MKEILTHFSSIKTEPVTLVLATTRLRQKIRAH